MTTTGQTRKHSLLRTAKYSVISLATIVAAASGASPAAATESVIYDFTGGTTDGGNPYAGLIDDGSGTLYGAAFAGGASGQGVVFKITTGGTFTPLASLPGGGNGAGPTSPPLPPISSNIFGTAAYGSVSAGVGSGDGTLYELTPAVGGGYTYN
ncbi:MAG TPA: choice-of-anchor tandem repeat GloVer-containing protein, partial [Beijerinckiaceae bacterium]|nr:choice-of-anchor tandem repeat GloVer-containing protein [Beijerinckiaceae bacterium]